MKQQEKTTKIELNRNKQFIKEFKPFVFRMLIELRKKYINNLRLLTMNYKM